MSCHRRNLAKIASQLSMIPSPLPPYSGLSYWANARNPFLSISGGGGGCGVKLPKSSVPLSIVLFPLPSTSIRIGEEQPVELTVPSGLVNAALVVSGVVPQPPPAVVQLEHVSSQ